MQISVPVTFDATNQTMSVSDSGLITFPQNTSDFSIVTVNGTACVTPTTVTTSNTHYVQFEIANNVEETEFDAYIDISSTQSSFNYWFELVSNGSPNQYSLVYNSGGVWWNPDGLAVNLPTQQWYTVKIVNNDSIKIYDKSTGNLVHSRSFSGVLTIISLANFYGATSYLTNLVLKRTINTDLIRYANTTGIAEIWANVKNWVLAHIGNGTLTIQKNGTNVTTFSANSSSNVTANITVPTKVSDLTNDSGFLTTANIPSKTSDLTNDSGFLTSHQSLSNYVTIDTAQDIEGNKNFKGLLTTIPNDTIWPVTASTSDDITYLGANAIHVEQKSSGKLTDLSNGAWSVAELGVGCFFFRINNGTDIRYKHLSQNTVNRIPVVSGANRFINDVTPNENNTYSLGTSSLRWSSCYSNAYYLGTTAFGDIVTHNASEFLTSHQSLANYSTRTNTVKSLSISGKTITVTPGSGSAYTLTTQDTVYTHPTTAGNKHIPSGGSSGQILKYSSSGTAVWADIAFSRTLTSLGTRTSTGVWSITVTKNTPIYVVGTIKGTTNTSSKYGVYFSSGIHGSTAITLATVSTPGSNTTYSISINGVTSATTTKVTITLTTFTDPVISLTAYQ